MSRLGINGSSFGAVSVEMAGEQVVPWINTKSASDLFAKHRQSVFFAMFPHIQCPGIP